MQCTYMHTRLSVSLSVQQEKSRQSNSNGSRTAEFAAPSKHFRYSYIDQNRIRFLNFTPRGSEERSRPLSTVDANAFQLAERIPDQWESGNFYDNVWKASTSPRRERPTKGNAFVVVVLPIVRGGNGPVLLLCDAADFHGRRGEYDAIPVGRLHPTQCSGQP